MKRIAILSGFFFLGLLAASALAPAPAAAQTPMHNCSFCHNLHGGPGQVPLSDFDLIEDMCVSCHGDAAPPQVDRDGTLVDVPQNGYAVHDGARHTSPTECWDCHHHEARADGPSGTNLAMIWATMPTPNSGDQPVVFLSRGSDASEPTLNSFADGDEDGAGDYTGVCETCHTDTSNHQNGLDLPDASNHAHEVGRTCTDCHGHDSGFGGGGPCASCHDTGGAGTTGANSRRAIIPELSRTSHHVGSGYVDTDCQTCHDMGAHQAGTVRLVDVDADTVIALAGDPATSSTEAVKLTTFCLACHDSDGAGGTLAPFSDGLTRPLIDETDWNAASHQTGTISCYGNGVFGCHASGHGSEKTSLLAPADSAATSPALAEQEEGFCFNCHDSDGPAGTDIDGDFAGSILWVTGAVGDNNNVRLNDRHDVQYAAQDSSGAKIECTDCHDPHSATSAQPWKTDPDPTDGRVPGTGQVFAGTDALSEFCIDCHDGSFPASVTAPTTGLNDVRTSWATDAMGGGGGNATLKSGYGWGADDVMPCASCHDPHTSGNLFHGDDIIYSKDGSTAVPSDGGSGYTMTDNNIKSASVNGYDWCNTCHAGSMGSKKANCFSCHYHGSRW